MSTIGLFEITRTKIDLELQEIAHCDPSTLVATPDFRQVVVSRYFRHMAENGTNRNFFSVLQQLLSLEAVRAQLLSMLTRHGMPTLDDCEAAADLIVKAAYGQFLLRGTKR